MEIVEVKLYTANLDSQLAFYHSLLGFPLIDKGHDHFSLRVGRTVLVFKQSEGTKAPYYHFAVNISENKIEQALKWVENKVVITENGQEKIIDFRSWNAHSIYFEDPAGNIVELIARHNLKNSSCGDDFTQDDFHCIDEIGLSFGNVLEEVERIKREFTLTNWRPASSEFAPVGDEDGLFIVVREGRTWYMSRNMPAKDFPLEISIKGQENKQVKIGNYIINQKAANS
jgi:catechol 2,3-dioxygenase-like lactoylglutathione lyase family enzyme